MARVRVNISEKEFDIFEDLYNQALERYGITDRKFIEVEPNEIVELQKSITSYITQHVDKEDSHLYAKSYDYKNGYKAHQKKLKNFKDNKKLFTCNEDMINSVVFYVTEGGHKTWPLYRSNVKKSKDKNNSQDKEYSPKVDHVKSHRKPERIGHSRSKTKDSTAQNKVFNVSILSGNLIDIINDITIKFATSFIVVVLGIAWLFIEWWGFLHEVYEKHSNVEPIPCCITGNVTSTDLDPLSNIEVRLVGTLTTAFTDEKGDFRFEIPIENRNNWHKLEIDCCGYNYWSTETKTRIDMDTIKFSLAKIK